LAGCARVTSPMIQAVCFSRARLDDSPALEEPPHRECVEKSKGDSCDCGLDSTDVVSRGKQDMRPSLNWNDIEFYFDFVFNLNGSTRNTYGGYAERGLFERCRTAIVSRL
jgi:hypothetical protein